MPPEHRSEATFHSSVSRWGIHALRLSPQAGPGGRRALVLHGLGDHSDCHGWVHRLLLKTGFEVVAFDWPGNGASGGVRGDIPPVPQAVALLKEFVSAEGPFDGVVAHSTGAFLLLEAMTAGRCEILENLRWIWFSSPLLSPSQGQSRWKIAAAHRLARWFPRATLSTGVSPRECFHSEAGARVKAEGVREGCHDRVSLRFAVSLLEAEPRIWNRLGALPDEVECFISQGSDDKVCPPGFAERFFLALPSRRKVFAFARGARHEPFRETRGDALINAGRAWLRGIGGGAENPVD